MCRWRWRTCKSRSAVLEENRKMTIKIYKGASVTPSPVEGALFGGGGTAARSPVDPTRASRSLTCFGKENSPAHRVCRHTLERTASACEDVLTMSFHLSGAESTDSSKGKRCVAASFSPADSASPDGGVPRSSSSR